MLRQAAHPARCSQRRDMGRLEIEEPPISREPAACVLAARDSLSERGLF
jgi:hypothetical protein